MSLSGSHAPDRHDCASMLGEARALRRALGLGPLAPAVGLYTLGSLDATLIGQVGGHVLIPLVSGLGLWTGQAWVKVTPAQLRRGTPLPLLLQPPAHIPELEPLPAPLGRVLQGHHPAQRLLVGLMAALMLPVLVRAVLAGAALLGEVGSLLAATHWGTWAPPDALGWGFWIALGAHLGGWVLFTVMALRFMQRVDVRLSPAFLGLSLSGLLLAGGVLGAALLSPGVLRTLAPLAWSLGHAALTLLGGALLHWMAWWRLSVWLGNRCLRALDECA